MDRALSHSNHLQKQDGFEQRNMATIRKNIVQDYDTETLDDPEFDEEIASER